jgi:hypothetical protein
VSNPENLKARFKTLPFHMKPYSQLSPRFSPRAHPHFQNQHQPPEQYYHLTNITDLSHSLQGVFIIDKTPFQGIITTNKELKILTVNDEALYTLQYQEGDMLGSHITNYIEKIPHEILGENTVVFFNKLFMTRKDSSMFRAFCQVSERIVQNHSVYIWMFDEIIQQSCILVCDERVSIFNQGDIVNSIDGELFGYSNSDLLKMNVTTVIPQLIITSIDLNKFYCGVSNHRVFFPLTCSKLLPDQLEPYITSVPEMMIGNAITLKVECMPNVAGMISVSQTGLIQNINNTFAESIFGISQDELIGSDISKLIPKYEECVMKMRWTSYIQEGESPPQPKLWCNTSSESTRISNLKPRILTDRVVTPKLLEKSPYALFCTPAACQVIAKHRDLSHLNVLIQCRRCKPLADEAPVHVLWISFHKEHFEYSSTNFDPPPLPSPQQSPNQSYLSVYIDTDMTSLSINTKEFVLTSPVISKPDPLPKSYPSISFPSNLQADQHHVIEDFDIIDSLGEGAYSFIKLCTYRHDPDKVFFC